MMMHCPANMHRYAVDREMLSYSMDHFFTGDRVTAALHIAGSITLAFPAARMPMK